MGANALAEGMAVRTQTSKVKKIRKGVMKLYISEHPLDCRPYLRRRRRLLVKMDQHALTPSRMFLRTDLAMRNADRRGAM